MQFDSLAFVFFTLSVIAPGVITKAVLESIEPRVRPQNRHLTFQVLSYGLFPFALILLAFSFTELSLGLLKSDLVDWKYILSWLGICVVSSIAQAYTLFYGRKFLTDKRILSLQTTPTAWEHTFFDRYPAYVIVSLKDGTKICGEFGNDSYAALASNGGDLFLQLRREIKDGCPWEVKKPYRGVWISADIVNSVEWFWTIEKETQDVEEERFKEESGHQEGGRKEESGHQEKGRKEEAEHE